MLAPALPIPRADPWTCAAPVAGAFPDRPTRTMAGNTKDTTMLSKFSIRSKIIAVVGFMTVAMLLLGTFAVFQMRAINAAAHEIQTSWLPSIRWVGEMRTQAARHRSNLRDHMLTADAKIKQDTDKLLEARMNDFNHAAKLYQPLISSDEERALARELQAAWKAYMASVEEVLAYSRKGDNEMAIATNAATTITLGRQTDALMARLVEMNDRGAAADSARAAATYNLGFWMVIGCLIAVLSLALVISLLLVHDVSQGVDSIIRPMRALGEGDLAADVPYQGQKTEIGQMADTLQVFKNALIAKKAADDAAAADAEAKIKRGQRVDAITREFETMVGNLVTSLSSASTELEAAANTLTSTADTTQQLSGSAASASRDVSDNVQAVAAASEEITSSVNEISRQVQELSRVAQSAVQQAEHTDANITELSKAAARIGDVVKLTRPWPSRLICSRSMPPSRRHTPATPAGALPSSLRRSRRWPHKRPRPPKRSARRSKACRAQQRPRFPRFARSARPSARSRKISATIASAVEEQGAATKEIARNMQEAARLSDPRRHQRHRRQQGRRRNGLSLDAGAGLGAVAVEGKQSAAARSGQLPGGNARRVNLPAGNFRCWFGGRATGRHFFCGAPRRGTDFA